MEGKETRFGIPLSALWAVTTSVTSCGAVNSMHDSFNAARRSRAAGDIHMGEVVFGGVGSGLAGMLLFALLAVFLAGLMVGRTPEYVGKKVQAYEIKMVALAILIFPAFILGLTASAAVTAWGTPTLNNAGPHGFSEMLYAFTSATGNNGSAFAGHRRQHRLLQQRPGASPSSSARFLDHYRGARRRRLAGTQAAGPAEPRHLPDDGVLWVGAARGHHRADRRPPDVLPCASAGAHRRALPGQQRRHVLRRCQTIRHSPMESKDGTGRHAECRTTTPMGVQTMPTPPAAVQPPTQPPPANTGRDEGARGEPPLRQERLDLAVRAVRPS